jgi:hypothetical protein
MLVRTSASFKKGLGKILTIEATVMSFISTSEQSSVISRFKFQFNMSLIVLHTTTHKTHQIYSELTIDLEL